MFFINISRIKNFYTKEKEMTQTLKREMELGQYSRFYRTKFLKGNTVKNCLQTDWISLMKHSQTTSIKAQIANMNKFITIKQTESVIKNLLTKTKFQDQKISLNFMTHPKNKYELPFCLLKHLQMNYISPALSWYKN